MSIKEIQRYAKLRAEGASTMCERLELLTHHQHVLKQHMIQLQDQISKLDDIKLKSNEAIR